MIFDSVPVMVDVVVSVAVRFWCPGSHQGGPKRSLSPRRQP